MDDEGLPPGKLHEYERSELGPQYSTIFPIGFIVAELQKLEIGSKEIVGGFFTSIIFEIEFLIPQEFSVINLSV